ncbi:MAG: FecR domain-containing protein [Verrucomicrobia bacterium]|nr:FecR domain-containing protein [Verrucomicrobiota bacterium]
MNPAERNELIDDLIEERISEADFLRLEAELSVDPAARAAYYERVQLSMALTEHARQMPAKKAPMRWKTTPSWLAMAALWVALAGIAALLLRPGRTDSVAEVESTANGYAALVSQVDAVWAGQAGAMADGALLPAGIVKLESGLAQVELFSGVRLVVEGTAEFEVLSPMEMRLTQGRVRAHVPETAHGFRIHTPEGDVVDLGTEFAVNASAQSSELHVLQGEVEWHPHAAKMQNMVGGEALRWQAGGDHAAMTADQSRFVGLAEIKERHETAQKNRRSEWLRFSEQMRRDPRLLACYRMDVSDSGERMVRNLASTPAAKPGAGAIVAARRAEDRWGMTDGALDFSPAGSRVRVSVPGEHGSLTMLCWVKINSLDRLYNSLFLTDGHEVGAPHWQITQDGRLFFSVKKMEQSEKGRRDKHNAFSPPFWNTSLSGQWLMLAVVYDVKAGTVTHFLNGEILSSETVPDDFLVEDVRIGNASIGNWSEPAYRKDAEFAVRNFNGSMDEFLLFDAALPATEISAIYEHGRP